MQTFLEIRERNCYYVDKSAYVGRLLDEGKHYFLSRPRRFGNPVQAPGVAGLDGMVGSAELHVRRGRHADELLFQTAT